MRSLFLLLFFLGGAVPVMLYVVTDAGDYLEVTRSELVISWTYLTYHISWLSMALFGFLLFARGGKAVGARPKMHSGSILFTSAITLFGLTVIGYAFYLYLCRDIIGSGGGNDFIQEKKSLDLTGTGYPIILIHLHLAFAILAAYLLVYRPLEEQNKRWILILCLLFVLFLDLVRSFGIGERLALMECILPFPIFYLAKKKISFQIAWIGFAVVGLVVFFVATESIRSWMILQETNADKTVWSFGANRLIAYYTTSINNASLADAYGFHGQTSGYYLLRGAFNTPVLGKIFDMAGMLGEDKGDSWFYVISSIPELNPEFNLFSAPGFSFLDFGYFGVLVGLLWGGIGGILVRGAKDGSLFQTLLCPIWLIGALEISRTQYFSLERNVPTYIAFFLIALLAKRFATSSAGSADPSQGGWDNEGHPDLPLSEENRS